MSAYFRYFEIRGRWEYGFNDPRGDSFRLLGLACYKHTQFRHRDGKFRDATSQTDQNLRKDPNGGLISIFQAGKMDGHLCWKPILVDRAARWTCSSADRRTMTCGNGRICQTLFEQTSSILGPRCMHLPGLRSQRTVWCITGAVGCATRHREELTRASRRSLDDSSG